MGEEDFRFYLSGAMVPTAVPLAHVAAFALGALRVEPPVLRILAADGHSEPLEPLVMQVLIALASARGATMSREDLIATCWAGRFVTDDAINRVISKLRKSLASLGANDISVETIPRVGYRLQAVAPGGDDAALQSRGDGTAIAVLPPIAGRKRDGTAFFAGTAVLVAAIAVWLAFPRAAPAQGTTIRVEPVASSAHDALAASFASDLITDLARLAEGVGNVNFIDADARGQSARSDYAVRVSVERQRDRLVTRTRLVSLRDGAVLWSRNFDGEASDAAGLREQVAIGAAGVLRCGMERSAAVFADDPSSVRLFFSACDAAYDDDWIRTSEFARQVVARRPDVAASWSCLALATLHMSEATAGINPGQTNAAQRNARAYARKAIRIDPHNGRGYYALAFADDEGFGSPRSIALLERGVAADPDFPSLHSAHSAALFNAGYIKASVAPALQGMALDPTSIHARIIALRALQAAGRNDKALAILTDIERLWPDHPGIAELRQTLAGDDAKRSDRDAKALYATEPIRAWSIVEGMAQIGDEERAYAWMARAPVTGSHGKWSILFGPSSTSLRRDPRFFATMARLGLVAIWSERGQWPDFCSEPGLRYDCRVEAARLTAAKRT